MIDRNYAENWIDYYDNYKSTINFISGDYKSLKEAIRLYILKNNPEDYNDWAESSEVGMFVNGLSYLGGTLHYRVDLNAHDIFPSTTQRRQSLLNFAKMLSYNVKRNICANGIGKIKSIYTNQELKDSLGNNLKNTHVYWNDSTNNNWLEQFLTIFNSCFNHTNPFGKPLKKINHNNITTQLYGINNIENPSSVYSFTANINDDSYPFEVVNADIDLEYNRIFEREPTPENSFHILYRNDGAGNNSVNTGFFVFWKQGVLNNILNIYTDKIENNFTNINAENINNYDVWVQEIDTETNHVKQTWKKIDDDEYLVYNSLDDKDRNIFKVETKDNDRVVIRYSDGKFGNIPLGLFRIWYRTSEANRLYIRPTEIINVDVVIPYKTNNPIDNNTYFLTLTFDVDNVSYINQSVQQESLEQIREKCPKVFSTQNRMVTGADYNRFPLSFGNQIKILNSIVRTYSGNSRYINFNDPTGIYKDSNIFAEDGYMYLDEGLTETSTLVDMYNIPSIIISNNIEPLLTNISLKNKFYNIDEFNRKIRLYGNNIIWKEKYSIGKNTSYGYFVDTSETKIDYSVLIKLIKKGSLILFKTLNGDEKWVAISNITYEINGSNIDYEVELNEVLDNNKRWFVESGFLPFNTELNMYVKKEIENQLFNYKSFGLRYNYEESEWEVISSYDLMSSDDTSYEYGKNTNVSGGFKDWFIKVEYISSNMWKFKCRYLKYVFGSENTIGFFFNTENKLSDRFITDDYIKISKIQTNSDNNYDKEYYWKPYETIIYTDGYIDNKKFIAYGYDSDKDYSIDNPTQYKEMGTNEKLFFEKTQDGYDVLLSSVVECDDMWERTTTSGYYYCYPCNIYPANMLLPHDIILTKSVRLSNGLLVNASETNPTMFYKDTKYPYDIVQVVDENQKQLFYYNSSDKELRQLVLNEDYFVKQGIKNITFLWKHYATSKYSIDTSISNIIDMFVLINTYYDDVQNWLKGGKNGAFPKLPSSYELKSIFNQLENYSMATDMLVWHPVKYRLLFGRESENKFRCSFKVIKNKNTTYSDNEIKKMVVESIDEYFKTMKVGEKYYFTNLNAFVKNHLGVCIDSFVPVPSNEENKFGNLFEIMCGNDEILLSTASIDDIQIIDKLTDYNINIGY